MGRLVAESELSIGSFDKTQRSPEKAGASFPPPFPRRGAREARRVVRRHANANKRRSHVPGLTFTNDEDDLLLRFIMGSLL